MLVLRYIYNNSLTILVTNDIMILSKRKGGRQMDKKIGKLIKVVRALTQLALEVGTLIAVIKMVIESIR